MIKDELKPILGDELFAALAAKIGDDKTVVIGNVQDLAPATQVAALEATIRDLKEKNGALEKQQADASSAYEKEKQAMLETWTQKEEAMQRNHLIEAALQASHVRSPKDFEGRLDLEKIEVKEGVLIGLDEQLQSIRKASPYLFADAGATPPPINPAPGQVQGKSNLDSKVDLLLQQAAQ